MRALIIATAGFWVFSPVLRGDWLWDDPDYVTGNLLLRDTAGLWKIWFVPGAWIVYYPLETTAQWVQWQLWGTDTLGYHLTNIALHIFSALLVWNLLSKLGLRLAWLGGLLFAVYPVMVESVVWITELKNTLSLPFFLLALCAWIDYEERKERPYYFLAWGFFLTAMLCKTSTAAFPFLIPLYACWKRGRIDESDARACLPFLTISIGLIAANVYDAKLYETLHATHAEAPGSLFGGLVFAGYAIPYFTAKCLFPFGLLPVYAAWSVDFSYRIFLLTLPILIGTLYALWIRRDGWGRHALLGAGFFLLNLLPVMGSLVLTNTNSVWSLDHLVYLPIIGLIGLAVAGVEQLGARIPTAWRPWGVGLGAGMVALLAWQSHAYAEKFVNQETLWTFTLRHNPDALGAHSNLSTIYNRRGDKIRALEELRQLVRLQPDDAESRFNLANALCALGQAREGMQEYARALQLDPTLARAYINFGDALLRQGRVGDAILLYQQAVALKPETASMRYDLGVALLQAARLPEAVEQLSAAARLDPTLATARLNLGAALARQGRVADAVPEFKEALRIKPDYLEAHRDLGQALEDQGKIPEAVAEFEAVLRMKPDDAAARSEVEKLRREGKLSP